jgi:hypothetical protein
MTTMAEPCEKCGKLDANQCALCNRIEKQAPIDALSEGYRRGLRDAFTLAQGAKLYSRGTPKETCTEIIHTLADLVNGGERAFEIAFSEKPSLPFPARMLNESDESLACRVDAWHKFK